jgi:hypothetical protein
MHGALTGVVVSDPQCRIASPLLTGDETPLPKMDIHAFMTKSFEVTKSTNEALLLL